MFKYFLKREIKESYLGNLTGFSWVLIQPILTLIIYTIVFEKIFKARIPEAENIGFIVYLAIGFWPWIAFSEAILKSITAVINKKDLIGKVKINLKEVVFATVTATFIINSIGYFIVLMVLVLVGKEFNYAAIPLLILPLLQLYIFALALGLILSSLQVFIRDTLHLMTTLITLWFFSTPIIYSESIMPESIRYYMQFNPVYTPITFIHNAILSHKPLPWQEMGILTIALIILLYLANKMFSKLSPNFEDYI
ncbi:MAG: ABC transporter permease [Alcanivoracaceae bacterium]|nr:ABC transporter permease [Alcanivoracaceae bacterium]